MNNFIIFFEEKEGTSPLMRLLDNFEKISVLHHAQNIGWEPFDRHNCGPLTLRDLRSCFDILFSGAPIDMARLNGIYGRTAKRPLADVDATKSVGFKMRFHSPAPHWLIWMGPVDTVY